MKGKIFNYILLEGGYLILSLSSVFSKYASQQNSIWLFGLYLGLEVLFLGIYALVWQQTLKRFPLMVAMSNKGITIVYSLIWAVFLFKESITITNLIGAGIIIFGIMLGSSDD